MGETFNNYGSYINSQIVSFERKQRDERRLVNPFVTISRQTGAYGITVSKGLCEYLQKNERRANLTWTVFDKELIAKVVQEHDLPETDPSLFI